MSNDSLLASTCDVNTYSAVAGYYLTESHTKVFSLLMLTWFLPAMVLSSGYKAVFFSMLTVPHYTSLVDNVEQLIQNPDIAVHVIRDASVQELFLVIVVYLKSAHYFILTKTQI